MRPCSTGCRDVGINLIDTAECYGDHLSEQLISQSIRRDREKWIVATKFGHQFHGYLDRTTVYDPADVLKQLEGSAELHLQTDYIDLYQFHSGNNEMFQTPGLWEMLNQQVKAGKVRHLGISVSPNDNIFQIERATEVGATVVQVIYNRIDRKPEQALLPSCSQQDLGVLARVPLASGFLSGKYKPGAKFEKGDVRSTHDQQKTEARLREVEEIRKNELPAGGDMAQWALAWCLKHDAMTAVIPGCKNVAQLTSNAAAAELARDDHSQTWKWNPLLRTGQFGSVRAFLRLVARQRAVILRYSQGEGAGTRPRTTLRHFSLKQRRPQIRTNPISRSWTTTFRKSADAAGADTICAALESRNCPECGRAFDAQDSSTIGPIGRPFGPISRWAVTPARWTVY